jgi:spermidine/putrescine transport system ATP-binding protein
LRALKKDVAKIRTSEGFSLVAQSRGEKLIKGQRVEAFVRPESVRLALKASGISKMENKIKGIVGNVLFNGANSRVLVQNLADGSEIDVAIPQTGEFSDLVKGQEIHIGWQHDQARCFRSSEGKKL